MNSDFRELLEILNRFQVDYLLVGGMAVIEYCEPRGKSGTVQISQK